MSDIGLVMSASIRNSFRDKIVAIIMIPVIVICVVGVALLFCLLLVGPEMEKAVPDRAFLESNLALLMYSSSLLTIGITLNSMVFQTMVREKTRGSLAALMATPLRMTEIWMGKSLALFVPGLVLGIVFTVLTLVIVNLIYFVPETGFLFTWEMALLSLVAVPLMYLFFGMLVHLLGYVTKSVTGNVIAQVFLPVMANVGIQLAVRSAMEADSWQFLVLHFGIAAVAGMLVLVFRSRLTPEAVILSAG